LIRVRCGQALGCAPRALPALWPRSAGRPLRSAGTRSRSSRGHAAPSTGAGAVNASSTCSSATNTDPPSRSAQRAARSASTGRDMSCSASKMVTWSYPLAWPNPRRPRPRTSRDRPRRHRVRSPGRQQWRPRRGQRRRRQSVGGPWPLRCSTSRCRRPRRPLAQAARRSGDRRRQEWLAASPSPRGWGTARR
jgi:hypothetical protein